MPNSYLDYFIVPNIPGINRLFVLSFENNTDRTPHTKYYLTIVEIKDYNVVIDGENFFDQPVQKKKKKKLRAYNIRKIVTGQGDDYTTGCCLLSCNYFNKYYKMIAIDLSKQQALDAYRKATQQINFTGSLS